ncbi:hypothetical protein ACPXCF_08675 [Streptomyces sp. DT171]
MTTKLPPAAMFRPDGDLFVFVVGTDQHMYFKAAMPGRMTKHGVACRSRPITRTTSTTGSASSASANARYGEATDGEVPAFLMVLMVSLPAISGTETPVLSHSSRWVTGL